MQNDNAIKTSCIDFLRNNSLRKYLKSIKIEKYNIDPPIPVIGWKLKINPSAKKEKNNSNPQSLSVEKDKSTTSYRTIYDMMRGRIAGVIVQQDNTIIIRGINSIRNNSEPLFVVDGNVVFSIDYIVPSEVQSITVLKDAEASIYGSRGSSGVIVIKLKK